MEKQGSRIVFRGNRIILKGGVFMRFLYYDIKKYIPQVGIYLRNLSFFFFMRSLGAVAICLHIV